MSREYWNIYPSFRPISSKGDDFMDTNIKLKAQNFLKQMDSVVEKEIRINQAMSVFENYTASNRLQGLIERIKALPESDLDQMYDGLIEREDWGVMTTNLDQAIEKIELASTTMKSSRSESLQWIERPNTQVGGFPVRHCPCGPPQELIDILRIAIAAVDLVAAIAQAIADILVVLNLTLLAEIVQAIASILIVVSRIIALIVAILVRQANIAEECENAVLRCFIYQLYYTTMLMNGNVNQALEKLECIENRLDSRWCGR